MTGAPLHHWTIGEVLRAWEVGALGGGVELLDGALWSIPITAWHRGTADRVARALPAAHDELHTGSLLAGASLPLPDCWVRRAGAAPTAQPAIRIPEWAPRDVLLVVEVSDNTIELDLGRKATLYAAAGYAHYWVVTSDGIYGHGGARPVGYRHRRLFERGEHISVPYADGVELTIDDLIGMPP